jgi:hypothetical protein
MFLIILIWFTIASIYYARRITLCPSLNHPLLPFLSRFGITPVQQSALLGIFFTNSVIGLFVTNSLSCLEWLLIPNLHHLTIGPVSYYLYQQTGIDRLFHRLPDILSSQPWFYTSLFCVLPIISMSVHLFVSFGWRSSILLPAFSYALSGGIMIVAQDLKYQLQCQAAKAVSDIIDDFSDEDHDPEYALKGLSRIINK